MAFKILYNHLRRIGLGITLSSILFLGLISCSSSTKQENSGLLQITTTITPVASVIKAIGDSLVNISVLLPQGNTPETYEPTTQEMQRLAQSQAYFYVGDLGFEKQWLPKIKDIYPHLSLIRLSTNLENQEHNHKTHNHISYDPHYWTSIEGVRVISKAVFSSLLSLDSIHTPYYSERFNKLNSHIDSLQTELQQQLQKISSRSFIIYHPSLTKFASEFDLEQLVIEEEGKEPSPKHLSNLIKKAKEQGVRIVFIQEAFDTKLTQTIANELGAKTVIINPLHSDWEKQLRLIVQALAEE